MELVLIAPVLIPLAVVSVSSLTPLMHTHTGHHGEPRASVSSSLIIRIYA